MLREAFPFANFRLVVFQLGQAFPFLERPGTQSGSRGPEYIRRLCRSPSGWRTTLSRKVLPAMYPVPLLPPIRRRIESSGKEREADRVPPKVQEGISPCTPGTGPCEPQYQFELVEFCRIQDT